MTFYDALRTNKSNRVEFVYTKHHATFTFSWVGIFERSHKIIKVTPFRSEFSIRFLLTILAWNNNAYEAVKKRAVERELKKTFIQSKPRVHALLLALPQVLLVRFVSIIKELETQKRKFSKQ